MKGIKLFLLILAMLGLLFSISCAKLKAITATMSSIPKDVGIHCNIGYGWDSGIDDPGGWQDDNFSWDANHAFGWPGRPTELVDPHITQMTGDIVEVRINMSPTEREASGLVALSVEGYKFKKIIVYDSNYRFNYDNIPKRVDTSNYDAGYIHLTFTFDSPGLYVLGAWDQWIVVRKE